METIVSVTGRLGTNVDRGQTKAGHAFASFRMATSRRIQKDGEWGDGPTSWITVKCFREFATNVSLSLRKGNAVVVVGRLEVEEWVSDQGVQRERAVIYAHAIGHDLKWGVSEHHRPARPRAAAAPPHDQETDDFERFESNDPGGAEEEPVAVAEAYVASIAERVGAHSDAAGQRPGPD